MVNVRVHDPGQCNGCGRKGFYQTLPSPQHCSVPSISESRENYLFHEVNEFCVTHTTGNMPENI